MGWVASMLIPRSSSLSSAPWKREAAEKTAVSMSGLFAVKGGKGRRRAVGKGFSARPYRSRPGMIEDPGRPNKSQTRASALLPSKMSSRVEHASRLDFEASSLGKFFRPAISGGARPNKFREFSMGRARVKKKLLDSEILFFKARRKFCHKF